MLSLFSFAFASSDVRILEPSGGASSSRGLLQVKTSFGYGSVAGMNQAAAEVACREMGFRHGSVSASSCSSYGGSNLCGSAGSLVALMGVKCTGAETSINECSSLDPDSSAQSHLSDSIVYCSHKEPGFFNDDGALRLISSTGAPSLDG